MSFAAANVFYNAFLIDITTEDLRDKVSSYGYGAGYLSGFLVLVLNLIFLKYCERMVRNLDRNRRPHLVFVCFAVVGSIRRRDFLSSSRRASLTKKCRTTRTSLPSDSPKCGPR